MIRLFNLKSLMLKNKIKSFTVYGITGILQGSIKTISTLFLGRQITAEEFSFIGLFGVLTYILGPTLSLGAMPLISVNKVDLSRLDYYVFRKKYINLLFQFFLVGLFISLITSFWAKKNYIFLLFISIIFSAFTNIIQIKASELIIEKKEFKYLFISLFGPTFILTAILLLNYLKYNSWYLYLILVSISLILTLTVIIFFDRQFFLTQTLFKWDKIFVKNTFKYGLPLIFAACFMWILTQSDKLIIKTFFGERELGIYSYGFIIGSGFQILNRAIVNTKMPQIYESLKNNTFKYSKHYKLIILINLSALFSGLFFLKFFSSLIIPIGYEESYRIMQILFFAFTMDGFFRLPGLVLDYHKKNIEKSLIILLSSLLFLIFTYLMINYTTLGFFSAAIGVLVGYISLFFITFVYSFKFLR